MAMASVSFDLEKDDLDNFDDRMKRTIDKAGKANHHTFEKRIDEKTGAVSYIDHNVEDDDKFGWKTHGTLQHASRKSVLQNSKTPLVKKHNMFDRPNVNPGRPKLIGQVLDHMDENEEFGEMRYSKFIKMADEVTTKMKQDCVLNAKCKFAYTKHHAFASHDEKRNKLDADVEENSSLMLAFMFYAAMQQTGSSSFTATQIANETLSFFEMDKFARDFGIVPKLMTKHELKIVWQDYIQIYAATTGGKPLQALNFEQFQDLFVRLALYMYNKPGMKKMILAVNGHFPSPEDIVECLCRHCNLQNFDAVKEHIMTEGRETQGAINFRAQEEENWRAKEELIIDLRAKHAERAAKKEEALKKKREQDKLKKQREELGIEEEEETKSGKKSVQYGLWSGSGGRSYDQGSDWKHLQARQAHKDKLRDKRSILPKSLLTMMKTLSEPELHADGSANTTTGGGWKVLARMQEQEMTQQKWILQLLQVQMV